MTELAVDVNCTEVITSALLRSCHHDVRPQQRRRCVGWVDIASTSLDDGLACRESRVAILQKWGIGAAWGECEDVVLL